jgi:hypothetical protein
MLQVTASNFFRNITLWEVLSLALALVSVLVGAVADSGIAYFFAGFCASATIGSVALLAWKSRRAPLYRVTEHLEELVIEYDDNGAIRDAFIDRQITFIPSARLVKFGQVQFFHDSYADEFLRDFTNGEIQVEVRHGGGSPIPVEPHVLCDQPRPLRIEFNLPEAVRFSRAPITAKFRMNVGVDLITLGSRYGYAITDPTTVFRMKLRCSRAQLESVEFKQFRDNKLKDASFVEGRVRAATTPDGTTDHEFEVQVSNPRSGTFMWLEWKGVRQH